MLARKLDLFLFYETYLILEFNVVYYRWVSELWATCSHMAHGPRTSEDTNLCNEHVWQK